MDNQNLPKLDKIIDINSIDKKSKEKKKENILNSVLWLTGC